MKRARLHHFCALLISHAISSELQIASCIATKYERALTFGTIHRHFLKIIKDTVKRAMNTTDHTSKQSLLHNYLPFTFPFINLAIFSFILFFLQAVRSFGFAASVLFRPNSATMSPIKVTIVGSGNW